MMHDDANFGIHGHLLVVCDWGGEVGKCGVRVREGGVVLFKQAMKRAM